MQKDGTQSAPYTSLPETHLMLLKRHNPKADRMPVIKTFHIPYMNRDMIVVEIDFYICVHASIDTPPLM